MNNQPNQPNGPHGSAPSAPDPSQFNQPPQFHPNQPNSVHHQVHPGQPSQPQFAAQGGQYGQQGAGQAGGQGQFGGPGQPHQYPGGQFHGGGPGGYGPHGGYPPAQPPKKKGKMWAIIIGIVLAIAAIVTPVIVLTGGDDEGGRNDNPAVNGNEIDLEKLREQSRGGKPAPDIDPGFNINPQEPDEGGSNDSGTSGSSGIPDWSVGGDGSNPLDGMDGASSETVTIPEKVGNTTLMGETDSSMGMYFEDNGTDGYTGFVVPSRFMSPDEALSGLDNVSQSGSWTCGEQYGSVTCVTDDDPYIIIVSGNDRSALVTWGDEFASKVQY